jgi:large subunit ribosomal protein L21
MEAIFKLSGFQFQAEEGAVIHVPLQAAEAGAKVDISEVLLVKDKDTLLVGTPYVEGAKVEAEVLGRGKSDKVKIYKYKRRTKYRRRQGHRQDFTELKVNRIVAPTK